MSNATVTMKTKGVRLRLGKRDFIELLKNPLLSQITLEEVRRKLQSGARLLDVRTPGEFNFKHMPGSINLPLPEIRGVVNNDHGKEYFTVCRTAAFILGPKGYSVAMVVSGRMHASHLSETAEDRTRNSGIYN